MNTTAEWEAGNYAKDISKLTGTQVESIVSATYERFRLVSPVPTVPPFQIILDKPPDGLERALGIISDLITFLDNTDEANGQVLAELVRRLASEAFKEELAQ